MIDRCEDKISKLPDSIVCEILSRLPTENAIQTSVLSKDWKDKWTSIYNIHIVDDESKYWCRGRNVFTFADMVDEIIHLTQNLRINSFRLTCSKRLAYDDMKTWLRAVLRCGIQILELNTPGCWAGTFYELQYLGPLKELKLDLQCTLVISVMKKFCPNLEILHLGRGIQLLNDKTSNTGEVLLDFSFLKELELICCKWRLVKSVVINAPTLTRFVAEDSHENIVLTAPSIWYVAITYSSGFCRSEVSPILNSLSTLVHLKLSSNIVEALTIGVCNLPCLSRLRQLELGANVSDKALVELVQEMPSIESLVLDVGDCYNNDNYVGLESIPPGIASCLKVVKLVGFAGTMGQINLANSALEKAEDLEKLIVIFCDKPLLSEASIMRVLLSSHKSSTKASIIFP